MGLTVAAAIAAGLIAGVVAFNGRAPDADASRDGAPPLALDAALTDPPHADELIAAERLYVDGQIDEARRQFSDILHRDPASVPAAVGEAVARWPAGTTARLRTLAASNPEDGLVRLHLGFALFWEERDNQALRTWQEVVVLEPDTPSALRAENLLHSDMPRGRPIFVPAEELPVELLDQPLQTQLAALEDQAGTSGTARSWISLGVALQRAGRAVSAAEAFERAAELDFTSAEARTAAALGSFTKEDPSVAFALLGPLGQEFPDDPVVSYHLGLALLWLGQRAEARRQLNDAVVAGPVDDFYPAQAVRLLTEIDRAEAAQSPSAPTVDE